MSSRLFKHWERWAIERGETPGSMKKMVEKMSGRGYRQARTNAGKGFNGVDIGVSAPSNLKAGVVSEVVDLVARKLEKAKKDDKAAE
jgi:hypothetical protein